MQHIHYFRSKKNNQEIFNKKLNWFFDIKTIFFQKISNRELLNFASQLSKDYFSLKKKSQYREKKIIKRLDTKKININKYLKYKKLKNIIQIIQKLEMNKYFKHFLIQGSVATLDFIDGYSDFDTFVVIKDEILKDKKKILKLRKNIKKIYLKILSFSKLQHHGLIMYTEDDLNNYLNGYLPIVALKKSANVFKTEQISFKISNQKKINLSKKILRERKKFIEKSIKLKHYNHHVRKNIPKLPFKQNTPFLYELFYHFGTVLNIPILYLDAIGKSSHKKKSFQKFYKLFDGKFVVNFIRKHEELRFNWRQFYNQNYIISKNLIDYLGQDYMKKCLKLYKKLILKLKIPS